VAGLAGSRHEKREGNARPTGWNPNTEHAVGVARAFAVAVLSFEAAVLGYDLLIG